MYFEINVAKNGKHFFATDERSITCPESLKVVLGTFLKKFPKKEGYELTVSSRELSGHYLSIEEAMKGSF